MDSIIYFVGVVVVIMLVLSFLGLRCAAWWAALRGGHHRDNQTRHGSRWARTAG